MHFLPSIQRVVEQILHSKPFFFFKSSIRIRQRVQSLRPVMQSLSKHNCLFIRLATTFMIYSGDRLLIGRPLYSSFSRLSLEFLNLSYHSKADERLKESSFYMFCNICKVLIVIFPSLTCSYIVRPSWARYDALHYYNSTAALSITQTNSILYL